jgi:hypothetical protein
MKVFFCILGVIASWWIVIAASMIKVFPISIGLIFTGIMLMGIFAAILLVLLLKG